MSRGGDPAGLAAHRTGASVDLLRSIRGVQAEGATGGRRGLWPDVLGGIGRVPLGSKHLRARLVHTVVGPVDGAAANEQIPLGACADLLHGAFLTDGDIVDRDDIRRGEATTHAAVRDELRRDSIGDGAAAKWGN